MQESFAVIFDMDGVIIDSNPWHKISLDQFVKKFGFQLTDQELREKIYGRTNREWIPNLFGDMSLEKLDKLANEKEILFRDLFRPHIKPMAGLITFLEKLDQNGISRAIATSAPPANVDFTLDMTGTRKFFQIILDDTQITHGKPHPEIYLKTAAALKKDPKDCIVIEDSLSGVRAGKDAGCKVVGITTTHSAAELSLADWVIHDFTGEDPVDLFNKVNRA